MNRGAKRKKGADLAAVVVDPNWIGNRGEDGETRGDNTVDGVPARWALLECGL